MAVLVGKKAPLFEAEAVINGGEFVDKFSLAQYIGKKHVIFFFYPLDFTFVCPTEIEEFGKNYQAFKDLNCEVIACSTDSHFSHLAWRSSHPGLKNLPYPMLADFTRTVASNFEVLKAETGYALRGLYLIDPNGVLQYSVIHPEAVGRNSKEVLRVLQALQSGKLTPCNWEAGQDTLN